jgi:hypothetical protein
MGKVFFSDPDLAVEIDSDPESNLAEYMYTYVKYM